MINFDEQKVETYGGSQDQGEYSIRDEGTTIRLVGNAWKSIPIEYEVTPYTILEFDFGSTSTAEIHAIGLDTDDKVSHNQTFKLFGTQNWGILQYFNYTYPGEWKPFAIPVGLHFRGPIRKMFFCVDDDDAPVNGDSWFRNIRLYESGDCTESLAGTVGQNLVGLTRQASMRVFPNPVRNEMNIVLSALDPDAKQVTIQLVNMMGQILKQKISLPAANQTRESLWVNELPAGTYILKVTAGATILMKKVVIAGRNME